jgi:uroporphyrinogen decarboxylase
MGLGLFFAEGEGPRFERPVRTEADVARLAVPDPDAELRYVMDAVRQIRRDLRDRVPLIGFSGSPFTLACYMIEGSGSDDWRNVKIMRHARPDLLHRMLDVNARAVSAYLEAQVEAGAQVAMIFDTWGGMLAYEDYEPFSLEYARRIVKELSVPTILFTKGGNPWLSAIAASGVSAMGLDWTTDARRAREIAAGRVALQGNLDPITLFSPEKAVREAARRVLDAFGPEPGHVFNLGHGILPKTPIETVSALVDEVRAYSSARAKTNDRS